MDQKTAGSEKPALQLRASVRAMTADDAGDVLRIYREGIETGHATFARSVPDWDAWDRGHLDAARIVGTVEDKVIGWAAFAPVSARDVYGGVTEISIYVSASTCGQGIGQTLMAAAIEASEAAGLWTLQAGIFPENEASIALHEAHGFVVVGTRKKIGRMDHGPFAGRWRDVVLMERRSAVVGTE